MLVQLIIRPTRAAPKRPQQQGLLGITCRSRQGRSASPALRIPPTPSGPTSAHRKRCPGTAVGGRVRLRRTPPASRTKSSSLLFPVCFVLMCPGCTNIVLPVKTPYRFAAKKEISFCREKSVSFSFAGDSRFSSLCQSRFCLWQGKTSTNNIAFVKRHM